MTVETSHAQTSEGLNMGYSQKPELHSLAAANQQDQQPQTERPAWLPDNFKTPEDFVKSHKELQGQFTKVTQELAGLKKTGDKPAEENDQQIENKLSEAGVPAESLNKWSETFWQTGEVPEEAYAELAKVGITKDIIDDYAETKRTLAQGQEESIFNAGGGRENVDKIMAWAGASLKPAEIDFFNNAFASGDLNAALVAMETLKGRYEAAEGYAPSVNFNGGNGPGVGGDTFQSTAQVVEAMSDRRYQTDPAYRAAVEAKIARSKVL